MEKSKRSRPLRVLAVDDDVDTTDSLALLLKLWGHEARVAYGGPAALRTALVYRPDVVLLDIALPWMDGYQVAKQLRRQTTCENALLVALTGYGQEKDFGRSGAAGLDLHLVKPVDPESLRELLAAYQELVGEGPASRFLAVRARKNLDAGPLHEGASMQATDWIIPLLSLTAMEIVLGIDNVIFIAIVSGRLPADEQGKVRQLGLGLALGTRLLLLLALSYLLGLEGTTVFRLSGLCIPPSWVGRPEVDSISWRDVILIADDLFLIAKSTREIHDKLEGAQEKPAHQAGGRFGRTLVQIAILDIVFSLDPVITAGRRSTWLWARHGPTP
jgi:CheY-like chemotaxis protein